MKLSSESEIEKKRAEAFESLEIPKLKWSIVAQVLAGAALIWVLAFMAQPYIGYWGVGIVGVLSLVAIGFGAYAWRMRSKSAHIINILKQATDKEGRQAALAELQQSADKKGDAMAAIAQAQLLAQDSPTDAIVVLEGINIEKASVLVQDDIRANLALLYLVQGRTQDARSLCDSIHLDRQPQAKAKAMYAAVVAEAFSRTGKAEEAQKILTPYENAGAEFAEVRPLLLRARVYMSIALNKRGLARKAMTEMAMVDPNMVGAFVQKGKPEVKKMAMEVLAELGAIPKQRVQFKGH
jgi:hypothetical protein